MVGEEEASDSAGAFGNKSVWARIAVVAAGPVFNFILAWVLALIIVGSVGYDNTMVDIIPDSAAAEAGMGGKSLQQSSSGTDGNSSL